MDGVTAGRKIGKTQEEGNGIADWVVGRFNSNLQRGGAEVAEVAEVAEKRRGICVILLFSAILCVLRDSALWSSIETDPLPRIVRFLHPAVFWRDGLRISDFHSTLENRHSAITSGAV